MDERKWILSFSLGDDEKSIMFWQLVAHPSWGETPEYTAEECSIIMKFVGAQPLPEFKNNKFGYKDYREWYDFKNRMKIEIKNLLDGEKEE